MAYPDSWIYVLQQVGVRRSEYEETEHYKITQYFLNNTQKIIVSTVIKQHWAKMEARHEMMREHWQHHQGAASAPAANQ